MQLQAASCKLRAAAASGKLQAASYSYKLLTDAAASCIRHCKLQLQAASSELQMHAIWGMSCLELHAGLEVIFDHFPETCHFL